jgi:signal peptidase I
MNTVNAAPRGKLRYLWATLLSLSAPGAGQIYAGRWQRGFAILAAIMAFYGLYRIASLIFAPLPLFLWLFLVLLGVQVIVLFDALRLVRRAVEREKRPWRRSVTLALFTPIVTITLLDMVLPVGWPSYSLPSSSNIPTLLVGDYFLADARPAERMPHRGEMMTFRYPRDRRITYVKRVIGLPGDRVQLRGGQIFLNGDAVPRAAAGDYTMHLESGTPSVGKEYIETLPSGASYHIVKLDDGERFDAGAQIDTNNTPVYEVPDDHVFVLGDNRDNSVDSRFATIGFVPISDLTGRAALIYYSADQSAGTSPGRAPSALWSGAVRWNRVLMPIR